MSEPMTMFTDYVLGILGLGVGITILRKNTGDRSISRVLWACAFLSLSLGALVGGTFHGFP